MSKSLREQLAERRSALEAGETPAEPNQEVELDETEEAALDETPEVAEEAAVEEAPETTEEPVAAAAAETDKPAAEAYVPDYKYKANGQEAEVPEFLRGIIKDKESQDKVVKMLEKYDAFDTVSSRRDQFRTERDQERAEKHIYVEAIGNMRNHVQRGDIDGFLKLCELPEEMVLKWATEKAKYYMGDDQYRQQVDQQNQSKQQSWSQESKANEYQSKYQEMEARQLQTEFNYEMLKPEVSSFVAAFDKFAGKQGAFIEEVRNRGELAYLREQKTIAPSEVIQSIMKQYSTIAQAPQQVQAASPNGQASKVIVKPAAKVATIPTVKGSSASPTKEGFTSLDQLREYRKSNFGR